MNESTYVGGNFAKQIALVDFICQTPVCLPEILPLNSRLPAESSYI